MSIRIGIISFMGVDRQTINKRFAEHHQQLHWCSEYAPFPIYVVAQAYEESWFEKLSEYPVNYDKHDHAILPGPAKNILLDDFYNSNDDWMILMDNDSTLHSHNGGAEIFKHMDLWPDLYQFIDAWVPVNGGFEPFRSVWNKEPEKYRLNWVFTTPPIMVKGSIFVLRNFYKHYGLKFHFGNRFVHKNFIADDTEFWLDMWSGGMSVYKCSSVALRENVSQKHTTLGWVDTKEKRSEVHLNSKMILGDKFRHQGLRFVNGRFVSNGFRRKFGPAYKEIVIDKSGRGFKPYHTGVRNRGL